MEGATATVWPKVAQIRSNRQILMTILKLHCKGQPISTLPVQTTESIALAAWYGDNQALITTTAKPANAAWDTTIITVLSLGDALLAHCVAAEEMTSRFCEAIMYSLLEFWQWVSPEGLTIVDQILLRSIS